MFHGAIHVVSYGKYWLSMKECVDQTRTGLASAARVTPRRIRVGALLAVPFPS